MLGTNVNRFVFSHSHLDHVGDMSLWPNTTEIIIGEGTDTRTYPTFANASFLESDFA
jgi:glyoxylase-like metal-dependent hydrolase (beta-lactamase superfamily II)